MIRKKDLKLPEKAKKAITVLIKIIAIILATITLTYLAIMGTMKENKNVIYKPNKSITNVFFYRDDCTYCRNVYPKMYLTKIMYSIKGKKILFVNTHTKNKNNKEMAKGYNIKTVPSVISVNAKGYLIKKD